MLQTEKRLPILWRNSRLHTLLKHDILFRWFVRLEMDEQVWDAPVFIKVLQQARAARLLSEDHLTVDGTLIEAWASQKSYQEKAEPPEPRQGSGRRGELFKRDQYESRTEPEARLCKKSGGAEAKLSYLGHTRMENRNGLVVAATAKRAATDAERETALELIAGLPGIGKHRITVAADNSYDEVTFVKRLRERKVTPHVAQCGGQRSSATDGRTTRHAAYAVSQERRKWIERSLAWMKLVGLLRRARLRGLKLAQNSYRLAAVAFHLARMRKLIPTPGKTRLPMGWC